MNVPRIVPLLLFGPTTLVSGGCCTLAELFCGPERGRWVSESYDTPDAALATFMEAVRRDNADVIYRCLGEAYKERLGVSAFETAIAWEKVKDQVPFGAAHLLGGAEVEGPEPLGRDGVRYVLSRSGQRVLVGFVRQPYWEAVWDSEGGPEPDGEYLRSLAPVARVQSSESGNAVVTRFTSTWPEEAMDLSRLQRATVGHAWKIDAFGAAPEP